MGDVSVRGADVSVPDVRSCKAHVLAECMHVLCEGRLTALNCSLASKTASFRLPNVILSILAVTLPHLDNSRRISDSFPLTHSVPCNRGLRAST
jgi:hypothetical protein